MFDFRFDSWTPIEMKTSVERGRPTFPYQRMGSACMTVPPPTAAARSARMGDAEITVF